MKILLGLFKSAAFLLGSVIFSRDPAPRDLMPPSSMHLDAVRARRPRLSAPLGGDIASARTTSGVDMFALLVPGLRSSLLGGLRRRDRGDGRRDVDRRLRRLHGGWLDDLLTVATNLFLVIPSLIVLDSASQQPREGRSLILIASSSAARPGPGAPAPCAPRPQPARPQSRRARAHQRLRDLGIVVLHILPYLLSYDLHGVYPADGGGDPRRGGHQHARAGPLRLRFLETS